MRKVLWKTVLAAILILLTGLPVFFVEGVAMQEFGGYVIFIGHVTTDEAWGEYVCYGSYYCNVSAREIIYDPENLLERAGEYAVCYTPRLSLGVGEEVICLGFYFKYGGPRQCYRYICCKEECGVEIGDVQRTEPREFGWYVCFEGHVKTDEAWGKFVCYGSYYCDVDVGRIIYDPDDLLHRSQTIAYKEESNLTTCEHVRCCGFYYRWGGPMQCVGYILCKYVERLPKLSTEVYFNLNPNPALVGDTVTLKGILVDEYSQPLATENVKLYARPLAGSWRYLTPLATNEYGIFKWRAEIPLVGIFIFAVYYPGSEMYEPCYNFDVLIVQ